MIRARPIVGILFGGALVWGLFLYGAKEPQTYYRLFIFLLFPAVIAALSLPLGACGNFRLFSLLVTGLFLLVPVIFQPTLNGHGFVIACLGWLALSLTLVLAEGELKKVRIFFLFLVILGGAEALYGLIQTLGGVESLARGTFTNRNHFAGLLNMTIPIAIGGLFANFSRRRARELPRSEAYARSWVIILSITFMGLAVLLSLSRAGTLSLLATLVLISILLTLRRQSPQANKLSGTTAWIVLFMTLGFGAWVGMDALLVRFAQPDTNRSVVYRDTLQLIADEPLLGIGPGMHQWRFRPYQTVDAALWYTHAHNDYLESAVEWGIPAAILFWGFVVWRFWRSTAVFLESQDPWRQGIALGCAGAIFSILLHSFVDFNLQIPANWMIFCVILGLAWSLESPASSAN
ncbi:MAG: O-antigen ligase family protein [Acidobacteriota bacterium]